ncbi:MAG: hypothetical protein SFZ23_14475 [Planctomycetota bacterium]|nr:hypothetical protein [Planctomycetota bacterium]
MSVLLAALSPTMVNLIGSLGAGVLLLAYSRKERWGRRLYPIMNIIGAAGLGASQVFTESWPGVALEVVWIGIAVHDLVRGGRRLRACSGCAASTPDRAASFCSRCGARLNDAGDPQSPTLSPPSPPV